MEPELVSNQTDTIFTVLSVVLPIVGAAVTWVFGRLGGWLSSKSKNEKVAGMIARLVDSVKVAVVSVNETAKAEIQKARDPKSPGGAKITKEEAEALKEACLAKVKAYWGKKGLKTAAKVLGFGDEGLAMFLGDQIEKAVKENKPNP